MYILAFLAEFVLHWEREALLLAGSISYLPNPMRKIMLTIFINARSTFPGIGKWAAHWLVS